MSYHRAYWVYLKLSVIVTFFLFLLNCKREREFPLAPFFKDIIEHVPKDILMEFKSLPLDSAVFHYNKYPEIFVDAAATVFEDSSRVYEYEDFCKKNGISLTDKQGYYTIVAVFHKRLNNEKVDIENLKLSIIKISNLKNEKKYGHLKKAEEHLKLN